MGLYLSAFVAFLLVGVPVAFALGAASAIYLILTDNLELFLAFPQRMIAGVDQFVLLTIPLFILAGNLMTSGGITDRIVRFSRAITGRIPGGLSVVNVVASMLFSGVSGSATADASALGSVMIPAMLKEGYSRNYTAALTAVSSVVGPIIPPSITMIIYGVLSGTSIADLFLAGVIPGLLIGFGLIVYTVWIAKVRNYPVSPHVPIRQKIITLIHVFPAMMLPLIILGGILSGVFTPTESAAIASIYALTISAFVYRTITFRGILRSLEQTAIVTAGVMFIVAMASMTAFIFGFESIPSKVAEGMISLTENKFFLLILINLFLLLLGLFLEPLSALILTVPMLLEIVDILDIDRVQFGMIVVLNVVIGMATPPVGLCLFIVCALSNAPLEGVGRACLPMLGICFFVLLLVTIFPQISLFIPSLFD
jgi:tripartite ATP-independent transporter DctM subunit